MVRNILDLRCDAGDFESLQSSPERANGGLQAEILCDIIRAGLPSVAAPFRLLLDIGDVIDLLL